MLAGVGQGLRERPALAERASTRRRGRDHACGRWSFAQELPLLFRELRLARHHVLLFGRLGPRGRMMGRSVHCAGRRTGRTMWSEDGVTEGSGYTPSTRVAA